MAGHDAQEGLCGCEEGNRCEGLSSEALPHSRPEVMLRPREPEAVSSAQTGRGGEGRSQG